MIFKIEINYVYSLKVRPSIPPPPQKGTILCAKLFSDRCHLEASWNVIAHAQKPDFVFRRNGRVHLNRLGRQFSPLLAAEVCASAIVMLNTPCSEVVWRVLATHSIRQFSPHFPSRASPCAITFQLESNWKHAKNNMSYTNVLLASVSQPSPPQNSGIQQVATAVARLMILHHSTLPASCSQYDLLLDSNALYRAMVPGNLHRTGVFTFGHERDVSVQEQPHAVYAEHKIPT